MRWRFYSASRIRSVVGGSRLSRVTKLFRLKSGCRNGERIWLGVYHRIVFEGSNQIIPAAHHFFRSGVIAPDAAHVAASVLGGKAVFGLTLDPYPIGWARGMGAAGCGAAVYVQWREFNRGWR